MALDTDNLQKASGGTSANPSIWTYTTDDDITDVDAADYWGGAPGEMKAGDIIHCNCADGFVTIGVTAIDQDAATSTVSAIGSGGNGGQVWVQANCSGYGTAGAVGYALAPVAGTILKWKHVLTTVVDGDVVLNLDIGGSNATGSITVASSGVAVGDVDSATVSAGGTVTEGQMIKIESDGGGTAGAGTVYILIQP